MNAIPSFARSLAHSQRMFHPFSVWTNRFVHFNFISSCPFHSYSTFHLPLLMLLGARSPRCISVSKNENENENRHTICQQDEVKQMGEPNKQKKQKREILFRLHKIYTVIRLKGILNFVWERTHARDGANKRDGKRTIHTQKIKNRTDEWFDKSERIERTPNASRKIRWMQAQIDNLNHWAEGKTDGKSEWEKRSRAERVSEYDYDSV